MDEAMYKKLLAEGGGDDDEDDDGRWLSPSSALLISMGVKYDVQRWTKYGPRT